MDKLLLKKISNQLDRIEKDLAEIKSSINKDDSREEELSGSHTLTYNRIKLKLSNGSN